MSLNVLRFVRFSALCAGTVLAVICLVLLLDPTVSKREVSIGILFGLMLTTVAWMCDKLIQLQMRRDLREIIGEYKDK